MLLMLFQHIDRDSELRICYSSFIKHFNRDTEQDKWAFLIDFRSVLTGSSFCTFVGVMYKTKTLVKFVDNRLSFCSLFLPR